ncbi:hypothetical protein [Salidesulfovibrio onnuriiensis]|uniref:hypothetical protein n=1 Tax=Salidesulfovibrio onnuriiensis TaxID=2583823 RepID=UPI0011C9FBD0|nr:hypothetical protein [Salidesulfovibrio onnuriiensis]
MRNCFQAGPMSFPVCIRAWFPGLVLMVLVGLCGACTTSDADAFTVYFNNSNDDIPEVWLQVQDPHNGTDSSFKASYGGKSIDFSENGTEVMMSVPVRLLDIGVNGLNVEYSKGALLYLFFDDPSGNPRTAAPAHMVSGLRFQPFELTMTGNAGDQGDLTAINYYTAPLNLTSYHGTPGGAVEMLQHTGFGSNTTATIATALNAACRYAPGAVVRNSLGDIVRFLGPSNFTGETANPWPSMVPYMQSVRAARQVTTIQNANGFSFAAPDNVPTYQFGCDLKATAKPDGSIVASGKITVQVLGAARKGNPAPPARGAWPDATVTISAEDVKAFNAAIYGQVRNAAVSFGGTGWDKFRKFTQNTWKDPDKRDKSLADLGAYDTTLDMIVGEITTGILGGFLDSDYAVGGTCLKDMPSKMWWSLKPMQAFSRIQPEHPYYNVYANVIYDLSGNTVYGVPYSDRFGSGPLVNSVQFDGKSVDYWVVDIGTPLGAVPAQ